jgi:hypothetical protein
MKLAKNNIKKRFSNSRIMQNNLFEDQEIDHEYSLRKLY